MRDGSSAVGSPSDVLRKRILEARRRLAPAEAEIRSQRIAENFTEWFKQEVSEKMGADSASRQNHPTIGSYRVLEPRDGEADPSWIETNPVFSMAHFAYPRILDRFSREMDFSLAIHPTDWVKGVYGVKEPRPELPSVSPDDLDIVIVPGVVFGEKGERIGRGAGYYDRYFSRARSAIRVGLAYDFQVLAENVPQSPWDASMDWIVTESRIILVEKAR
jgi:5,10-methenyltetrahydrofolate synthetase